MFLNCLSFCKTQYVVLNKSYDLNFKLFCNSYKFIIYDQSMICQILLYPTKLSLGFYNPEINCLKRKGAGSRDYYLADKYLETNYNN